MKEIFIHEISEKFKELFKQKTVFLIKKNKIVIKTYFLEIFMKISFNIICVDKNHN